MEYEKLKNIKQLKKLLKESIGKKYTYVFSVFKDDMSVIYMSKLDYTSSNPVVEELGRLSSIIRKDLID